MKKILLLITLTSLVLPDFTLAEPVEVNLPQKKVLSSPNGQYVFGQISDFRADQFLLDTQTGRLWQIVIDGEEKKKLQPVAFIQVWGDESYIPDPLEEVEGQRKLMLMKRAEDMKKLLEAEEQQKK